MASRRLDRPSRREGRLIAGVCAGLADHYGWDRSVVRLLFLLFGIVGAGEIAYIALWILMPNRR